MNIFQIILVQPLANGLVLFYHLLGQNIGLSIITFSLALRIALTPLTRQSTEAMKKMREFAPEIEKLKKKHKDDRQALTKAQADFYKEKGINPGAGCLPQIIQIVIFIALLQVFTGILSGHGQVTENFNKFLYPQLKFSENAQLNTHFLYLDVTRPDVFSVPGIPFPLPGIVLIVATLVQFLSAKMAMPFLEQEVKVAKKTKGEEDDAMVAAQNSMIYTFPILTLLAGSNFPSGMALYWTVFSIYQAVVQYRSSGWGGLTPWLRKLNLIK
jgi:YidC/Oxa1 family membrane protein insertase